MNMACVFNQRKGEWMKCWVSWGTTESNLVIYISLPWNSLSLLSLAHPPPLFPLFSAQSRSQPAGHGSASRCFTVTTAIVVRFHHQQVPCLWRPQNPQAFSPVALFSPVLCFGRAHPTSGPPHSNQQPPPFTPPRRWPSSPAVAADSHWAADPFSSSSTLPNPKTSIPI